MVTDDIKVEVIKLRLRLDELFTNSVANIVVKASASDVIHIEA